MREIADNMEAAIQDLTVREITTEKQVEDSKTIGEKAADQAAKADDVPEDVVAGEQSIAEIAKLAEDAQADIDAIQHEEDSDLVKAKTLDFVELPRAPVRRVTMKWVTENQPLPQRDHYIYVTDEGAEYIPGQVAPFIPYKKEKRKGLPKPPGIIPNFWHTLTENDKRSQLRNTKKRNDSTSTRDMARSFQPQATLHRLPRRRGGEGRLQLVKVKGHHLARALS